MARKTTAVGAAATGDEVEDDDVHRRRCLPS
jgi:hypothetical protein